MIEKKKEFYGGFALLIGFVVVLVIIFSPVFKGQNGLEYLKGIGLLHSKGQGGNRYVFRQVSQHDH
jgi:hypothetical protein